MAPPPTLQTMFIERLSEGSILISYNSPRSSNAFTPQTYDDLRKGLVWAREEPSVNVVLVNGKGKHFCAGRAMGGPENTIDAEIAAGGRLGQVLASFPKVLIAAIHGASIGWGCTQLSNFDLIYAHASAFFQTPFMPLGLVPEGGSSYTFPALMGRPQANALLLAGDCLTAEEAYVAGLVTKVVRDTSVEEFHEQIKKKAVVMGGYSSEALQMAKRLIGDAEGDAKEKKSEAGKRERRDLVVRFSREDTKERLAAFGGGAKAKAKI